VEVREQMMCVGCNVTVSGVMFLEGGEVVVVTEPELEAGTALSSS